MTDDDERARIYLQAIDEQLKAVSRFLDKLHAKSPNVQRVRDDIATIINMPSDQSCSVECKRALLLYAISSEHEIADAYTARDGVRQPGGGLSLSAIDMQMRVLPKITPRFVANMCQRPGEYVRAALVLGVMWANEPLGGGLGIGVV